MSEKLGRIEKPQVSDYTSTRKLYFIPLANTWPQAPADYTERFENYWEQVVEQLNGLELKLGTTKKVYHEFVTAGGEEGVKMVDQLNPKSTQIIRERMKQGAFLELIEDEAALCEFMDWSRCLSIDLQSEPVFKTIYEAYNEVNRKRNEHVARRIDETLGTEEAGMLFMREGHQVQFPPDIQIIYVAPPALDELKRWLRDQEAMLKGTAKESKADEKSEVADKTEATEEPKATKKPGKKAG